jgi:hypothetical protein
MVEQARTTGDAAALRDLVENPTKVVEDLLATSLFKAFVPLEQLVPKLVGLADEKVPLDYREAFEVVRAALTTPRTDGRPRGTKPTENGAITHLQPTFSETVPAALRIFANSCARQTADLPCPRRGSSGTPFARSCRPGRKRRRR